VHLQRGDVGEEARADELGVLLVVAQDVAHVLADEALDALAELLHPLDVLLLHAPGAVGGVGLAGLELLDGLLDRVVPGHVGDEILDEREGLHGLDGHRLLDGQLVEAGHAHQLGHAVDLGRAGAALAGLAVPAAGEIVGRLRLDLVDGVEDHHALADLGGVVLERPALPIATPDAKGGLHLLCSSTICFNSAGMGGSGSRRRCMAPSGARHTTLFQVE
jgi:hypothetical protein